MKMNQQTKLMYILEHLYAMEDLLKDNIDEALLCASIRDIKFILERQRQSCVKSALPCVICLSLYTDQ